MIRDARAIETDLLRDLLVGEVEFVGETPERLRALNHPSRPGPTPW